MMQDSFGKVVNQAVRGHAIHTPTKTSKTKKLLRKNKN